MKEWTYLILAGVFEIIWSIGLKYTDGFTKILPTLLTILAMIISFTLLSWSLRIIPLGVAYTIWTSIGAMGALIAGVIIFEEEFSLQKLICILLIIIGVIGLKFSTNIKNYN